MSSPDQNKNTKNEKVTEEPVTREQVNIQAEDFKPFDTVSFPTGMSNHKFDGFQASIDNGSEITGSTILGSTDNATKGNSFPIHSGVCHNTNTKVEKDTPDQINKKAYKMLGALHTKCHTGFLKENEYVEFMKTLQNLGRTEGKDDEFQVVSTDLSNLPATTAISKHRRYFKYDPYTIQQILVNALNAGNVTPEHIQKYNELTIKGDNVPPLCKLLGTKDREVYCSNFINDSIQSVISPLNGLWLRITKIVTRGGWKISEKESNDFGRMYKNPIGWNYGEKQKTRVVYSHGFYVQLFNEKNDTYPLDMGMTNSANVPRNEVYWAKPRGHKNPTFCCDKSYSRVANGALFTLSRNKQGTWISEPTNTAYPVIIEDLPNTPDSYHQVSGDIYFCMESMESMEKIKRIDDKLVNDTMRYNTKIRIGQMCSWWTSNPAPMPRDRNGIGNVFALIDNNDDK